MKKELHLEILDKKYLSILPKLNFLKREKFYLAGGTALALQIGHRKSVDFDLYRVEKFNPSRLLQEFQRQKPKSLLIDYEGRYLKP